VSRERVSFRLPDFPWDSLAAARTHASAHPEGIVDLSMGTPVDPTPDVVQAALSAAADAPGYPLTAGSSQLRESIADWVSRRCDAQRDSFGVLPTIGAKELVAGLPTLLGLGPGDVVIVPEIAYPTYEVGARLVSAQVVRADSLLALGPLSPALIWVNSPANPTGRILPVEHLAKVVSWARQRGALLVSDECYLECAWDTEAVSVLDPRVCGDSVTGLLAVHSLSKRSNMAGYRAGFVSGDPAVVTELLAVRKNLGLIVPAPVQAAMCAALSDDDHMAVQRERYLKRRALLRSALDSAGFRIEHSEGSLYLWATRDENCWQTVEWLADRGVLVAPGDFYGPAGASYVRVALTATDVRIEAAVARLA
jgi:succinyldiaminopimelate transaminase